MAWAMGTPDWALEALLRQHQLRVNFFAENPAVVGASLLAISAAKSIASTTQAVCGPSVSATFNHALARVKRQAKPAKVRLRSSIKASSASHRP
jgi:hypothetical protein